MKVLCCHLKSDIKSAIVGQELFIQQFWMGKMDIHWIFHSFNAIQPVHAHTRPLERRQRPFTQKAKNLVLASSYLMLHDVIPCLNPFCYPSHPHGSRARARTKQSGTTTCDVLSGCCTKATPAAAAHVRFAALVTVQFCLFAGGLSTKTLDLTSW